MLHLAPADVPAAKKKNLSSKRWFEDHEFCVTPRAMAILR